ncbi:hypothetical protein MTR67_035793, partial [Solanum verrucosum]
GCTKKTRFLITIQNREKCKLFASKDAQGFWKPTPKRKSIFDAKARHIGNMRISWYYYYNVDDGRDKSSSRLRKSEWQIREYYLASNYLPQNKVERTKCVINDDDQDEGTKSQ